MRKKERKLYKSGENNKNSYKFHILSTKERRKAFIVIVLCVFGVTVTVLEFLGITNWNKISLLSGAVDGIKVADTDFAVYFLDVGQSDCSIVVCEDEVMVIDTGSYPQFNDIQEALFTLEVDEIDYLVVTHPHNDHMSNAERLINNYKVKNILMPRISEENFEKNEAFERLLHTIDSQNITALASQDIDCFNLGSAQIKILSPHKQYNELNNMSLVMKVTYGETSFLFQGDAESQVEKELLYSDCDLSANVLKLGHHGSKTASTEKYLDAVNPEIAVVSCGQGNSYGHPRVTVMEYLVERNIDYYITVDNGDITISSDGKNIEVFTQKDAYYNLAS